MRRVGALGAWLLLLTLLAPAAAASNVAGTLVLDGPLRLVDGGHLEGPPLALVLDTHHGDIPALEATFPKVRVTEYWRNDLVVSGQTSIAASDVHATTRTFTNARIVPIPGNHSGVLGISPGASALLNVSLASGASVLALDEKRYASATTGGGGKDPELEHYDVTISVPHVNVASAGLVQYAGPGGLKVWGLDFEIVTAQGAHRIVTGIGPGQEGVSQIERKTWAYLEFTESSILLDAPDTLDIALKRANVSWAGEAKLYPSAGTLVVDGQEVAQTGDAVTLPGPIAGTAAPDTKTGETRLGLSITSVEAPQPGVSAILTGNALRPFDIVLLLGIAAGAGTLAVWTVRRRAASNMDADEMLTLAHLASEGGRHDEALGWVRRARGLAPQSGVLALEEAFHLGELGLVDEALATYREAARLSDDGQAEFDAALLAHRSGGLGDAEIETLLVGALEKNPGLVLELDESLGMRLRPVASPALEAAIVRAHRRLDRA